MKIHTAMAIVSVASLLVLTGCGGGSTGDAGPGGTPLAPETARPTGTLLQSPPVLTVALSAGALKRQLEDGPRRDRTLLSLAGDPICDVAVRQLQYSTLGGAGEATTASGALMLPSGTDPRCTGARPILLYAHATHPEKSFNLARLDDDTNAAYTESLTIAAIFAARGYIVVAPNYAGYDSSTLGYHPFLNATQQSDEMLDVLAAAKTALSTFTPPVTASSQLFLTGYSQGGFVALATLRALDRAGATVTAAAPMSGPYALARALDDNFAGQVHVGSPLFASLLANSYQRTYGNVYAQPTDLYENGYAGGIESLLPGADAATLGKTGKLPLTALFSKTPPTAPAGSGLQPQFDALTPATGTAMDAIFARGFGSGNLFTNSFRAAYLTDLLTHPSEPRFGLRTDALANDLSGYIPKVPVMLCGGEKDATVSYARNTGALAQAWAGRTGAPLLVLDVDQSATSTSDPFFSEKLSFGVLKALTEDQARLLGNDPDWEVARNYHAAVFPFCTSAVGKFFGNF